MEEQERISREYEHALYDVENDVQNKSSLAWNKLCEYVELVEKEQKDEFSTLEYLGKELFAQIHTLPKTISRLKKVKKIWLYGSQLKRIPPEIGKMESLEYFDPYTSYQLHWFPYEITNCKKLKDSRVSTRALYGNYKYRRPFPNLSNNPVRYDNEVLTCSVCNREITYKETNQMWISLGVGTDVLPLLVNLCSKECENSLPKPGDNYLQYPHKGSDDLKQPMNESERREVERNKRLGVKKSVEKKNEKPNLTTQNDTKFNLMDLPVLKVIKKMWEK